MYEMKSFLILNDWNLTFSLCLQESHAKPSQHSKLSWILQVYPSPSTSKPEALHFFLVRLCLLDFSLLQVPKRQVYNSNWAYQFISWHTSEHLWAKGCLTRNQVIIYITQSWGDFNCYLNSYLDRMSSTLSPNTLAVQTFNRSQKKWWIFGDCNTCPSTIIPFTHTYTNHTHGLLSDSRLISNINLNKYHNIILSAHGPVNLSLKLSSPWQAYSWRFNPHLLKDQAFKTHITSQITQYLENNDNGEVKDTIV